MTEADNELLNYWKWLSSLREPVRDAVLKCWDETGRPLVENPVQLLLVKLCELNAESGYEAFAADAKVALRRKFEQDDRALQDFYVAFMAGAIWGTISIRDQIREINRLAQLK